MKTLAKYLKKRKAAIDFLLRKPSNEYTPNTFHKLRVEIKKLNSLFDLIHFCSNDFRRKKTYKPFKSIFKQAGKIRELQIEAAMLKKYCRNNSTNNYRKRLKRLRLIGEEDFFLLVNKKLMNQLNKKYRAIVPHLNRIDKEKINAYLQKKKNHIKELLGQESIQTKQIHKLRKHIKVHNYNKAILYKDKQEEKISKQDVLPELLGKWHDCQVIKEHLKKELNRGKLSRTEIDQIKTIKSKMVRESMILFNEIKILIPDLGLLANNN